MTNTKLETQLILAIREVNYWLNVSNPFDDEHQRLEEAEWHSGDISPECAAAWHRKMSFDVAKDHNARAALDRAMDIAGAMEPSQAEELKLATEELRKAIQ